MRGSVNVAHAQVGRAPHFFPKGGESIFPFILLLSNGAELHLAATSLHLRARWMRALSDASVRGHQRPDPTGGGTTAPSSTDTSPASPTPTASRPRWSSSEDEDDSWHDVILQNTPVGGEDCERTPVPGKQSDVADQCHKSGWHLAVANISLHRYRGVEHVQSDSESVSTPVPASNILALWTIKYVCSSMEWVVQRTFSDLVEFDVSLRKWLQHSRLAAIAAGSDARHCRGKYAYGAWSVPQLPDVERRIPQFLLPGSPSLLADCTNKLLCHSPRNPVDARLPVGKAMDAPGTHSAHSGSNLERSIKRFFALDREILKTQMNAYLKEVTKMDFFHDFMIRTGSQVSFVLIAC